MRNPVLNEEIEDEDSNSGEVYSLEEAGMDADDDENDSEESFTNSDGDYVKQTTYEEGSLGYNDFNTCTEKYYSTEDFDENIEKDDPGENEDSSSREGTDFNEAHELVEEAFNEQEFVGFNTDFVDGSNRNQSSDWDGKMMFSGVEFDQSEDFLARRSVEDKGGEQCCSGDNSSSGLSQTDYNEDQNDWNVDSFNVENVGKLSRSHGITKHDETHVSWNLNSYNEETTSSEVSHPGHENIQSRPSMDDLNLALDSCNDENTGVMKGNFSIHTNGPEKETIEESLGEKHSSEKVDSGDIIAVSMHGNSESTADIGNANTSTAMASSRRTEQIAKNMFLGASVIKEQIDGQQTEYGVEYPFREGNSAVSSGLAYQEIGVCRGPNEVAGGRPDGTVNHSDIMKKQEPDRSPSLTDTCVARESTYCQSPIVDNSDAEKYRQIVEELVREVAPDEVSHTWRHFF